MGKFRYDIRGAQYEIEAPTEAEADKKAVALSQQPQHFELGQAPGDAPGIAGPKISTGHAAMLGASDIGTAGFGDEAAAALNALTGSGTYEGNLEQARLRDQAASLQHPRAYLGGQIAGGLTQAIPMIMSGGAATAPAAGGAMSRILGNALVAGGLGAAHGAGSGTDAQSRLTGAGVEGATGLAGGALFGTLGEGIGAGFQALRDRGLFQKIATLLGTTPSAVRQVLPQVEAMGAQGAQNIGQAGQGAMLADAGAPLVGLLDTAIQKGGVGGARAQQAIDQRVAQAGQNLTGALDQTLGAPQGVTAAQTALRQGSQPARAAAYNAAYASPIDYASPVGQEIENLVLTRVPAAAIERANALMRVEGEQSRQILARIAPDGSVTFERLPDVRQLDYITRGLNDVARSGEGAGALGGQTDIGRAFQSLSREIRNRLRTAVPEYATALDTAADPIRRSEALQIGADALGSRMTRDAFAESIDGMSNAERQAVSQGIRSHIDDTMANVQRTLLDPNVDAREAAAAIKQLSSRGAREKVAMVVGQREADRLFARVDEAARAFDLRAGVTQNSRTFGRTQADQMARELVHGDGMLGAAMEGKPINAVQRLVQALTGRTPEAKEAALRGHWGDVVDLLTMPAGRAGPMMNTLQQASRGSAANAQQAALIARLLSGGVYPGLGPATDTMQRSPGR